MLTESVNRHDAEEIHPITLGATTSERLEKTLSTMDAVETEVAESDNYSEFMQLNGARPLNFELWNSVFYESKDTQVIPVYSCCSFMS